MTRSRVFSTGEYKVVEEAVAKLINRQPEFLSIHTAHSTRAVGDAIEEIVSGEFEALLGDSCARYSAQFARRAMADLAFYDTDGLYYVVDVKTHRRTTQFNMPNLVSVERLARFYEDDANYFVILMIQYDLDGTVVRVERVHFVPIEFLSWSCLTIGALGWGQIQIANANMIKIDSACSRKRWMIELCDTMLDFYPREFAKIAARIEHFRNIKRDWEGKADR